MKRKRKNVSSSAAATTIDETTGLHSVADESRRKIFNAAAKALGHEDQQVEAQAWKRMVQQSCPDVFFQLK